MSVPTTSSPGCDRARGPRLAIIGGGPGGLMTAYELQRLADRPIEIVIFEASDRLGGKIRTPTFEARPIRYEAGAAEFYDYEHLGDDPLKDLVRELGLPIAPLNGSSINFRDRVIATVEDVVDGLGPEASSSYLEWHRRAADLMTPTEFYGSDEPRSGDRHLFARGGFAELLSTLDADARALLECQIHSDLATEPSCTSVEYGLQNHLMNDPAYMRLYGIVGGNEQLPIALADRIHADVRLGSVVNEVRAKPEETGGGFEVSVRACGTVTTDTFDLVVLALPHDAVPHVALSPPTLGEPVRSHWSHHDHPAHYLRITMLFERAFWRDAMRDSFCMNDAFGGCCLYDESSRCVGLEEGVLGWLLGGEAATKACEVEDHRLIADALESLPASFGANGHRPIEARVHRWRSSVSALPGGIDQWPIGRRHQPAPRHPDLHIVGDYLYDSTLNGVHDSATYVASCIAADLAAGRWSWNA
jgi:protoporphyrinogen oxidase